MKWIAATVSVTTDESSGDAVLEIIADLFYGQGLNGVVINETQQGGVGEALVSVTGYFPDNALLEEKKSRLEGDVGALTGDEKFQCKVSYEEIDEEDWADSWKAHFYPQQIGRHLVVKPTWRDYRKRPDDIVIELDPGMAFGTGTHETTRMCMIMLERYIKQGMSFLDVGTGSGILMIAACRLGAKNVCGVDNDPVAVETAMANLALNRVSVNRDGVLCTDLIDGVSGNFEMVCANILAEVVVDLIPDLKKVLVPGGVFVGSGIIRSKEYAVEQELRQSGFDIIDRTAEADWVCIVASAPEPDND